MSAPDKFFRIELLMPFRRIIKAADEKAARAFADAVAAQAVAQFGVRGILREITPVEETEVATPVLPPAA